MRIEVLPSVLFLSFLDAAMAGKHKKGKPRMSYSMSMPTKKAKQHKHRQKKLEHSLIQKKSLEPRFGPKHKGRLCDTLTSSVILFDVDESGGLDWSEFQVFNTAIVDVVKDHTAIEKRHLDDHEISDEDLGKVYHDMACECHFTFGEPLKCCHDDKPPHKGPVQVSFDGLNVKGDGRSDEDKQYRRNFCNGIMYLLESEGIDLGTANDAILEGLNIDIVDFDIIDGESAATVAATVTTEAWFEDEDASVTETLSNASVNEIEPEDSEAEITETEAGSMTTATVAVQSTEEATESITENAKQIDASTSSIMTASTIEDLTTNDNSSVATGVTIGVLFALIALILGIAMAVVHRKREEKKRLAEFAGEELIDDDVEANSVHNDVVAIDTMDSETIEVATEVEKEKEEVVAETEEAATADKNDDDNSDAMSVVSLNHDECAQISFQEDQEGGVEAKVSTLAAMGVASTVTSRLSTQQPGESDV